MYETLRKQQQQEQQAHPPAYAEVMTSSSGSSNCGGQSATGPPVITPKPTIKGIRSKLTLPTNAIGSPRGARRRQHSPPELPPPPKDINELYAKVDRAKKKKNRESSDSSNACSPSSEPSAQVSPTKSLIQKFNTLGQAERDKQGGQSQAIPPHYASPARRQGSSQPNSRVNLVTNPIVAGGVAGLGSQESLAKSQGEPMYATIGSKNRSQIASRFSKPDNV